MPHHLHRVSRMDQPLLRVHLRCSCYKKLDYIRRNHGAGRYSAQEASISVGGGYFLLHSRRC
ncbi:unnamed protein product [Ectocarpus sp. 8 AP-2014]